MMPTRSAFVLAAVAAAAGPLSAQRASSCPSGPGAAFGVIAYQCASCAFKQGARPEYTFQAEPLLLETAPGSLLRAGDVIEAVDGQPITTRAGADEFTYPRSARVVIAVRRGGTRVQVTAPAAACSVETAVDTRPNRLIEIDPNSIERIEVLKGAAAATAYGGHATDGAIIITTKHGRSGAPKWEIRVLDSTTVGGFPVAADRVRLHGSLVVEGPRVANQPLIIVDGVVVSPPSEDSKPTPPSPGGRFGVGVACQPSCTRVRTTAGIDIWKFDANPPVVAVKEGSAGATAGVRVGDIVTQVDGIPITTDAGALRFFDAERNETMRLTVVRDGKQLEFVLRAR
jgi:TonB-dependent SusC/RagA subfamily outer membrane receptor